MIILCSCSAPEPADINAMSIDETEERRRAQEFISKIYDRYGGTKGLIKIGVINPRGYDFSQIVAEFAARGGAAFIEGGQPDFIIKFEIDRETIDREWSTFDVSAYFIEIGAAAGGLETLFASRKKRRCLRSSRSDRFICAEAPQLLAKATLYSFIHP